MFRALYLTQTDDKNTEAQATQLPLDALPDGDVLVEVSYSSLNYKDGLAVTGTGKVVRAFPMVPGIDFVGTVLESETDRYTEGDAVILTGWGVGEKHWGGFAQRARVSSDWLVPLPEGLSPLQAMTMGTAGLTATMAVVALEKQDCTPDRGEVIVTGASGGVGSVAVALLSQRGYTVVAATGRAENADYLKDLGAASTLAREDIAGPPDRPLQSERWAGAIDTVGGDTLAYLLSTMAYGGSIASIGLAGGHALNTTVFPFILRGVNLLGIDSVMAPYATRVAAWEQITRTFPVALYEKLGGVEPLSNAVTLSEAIINGDVRGRVVIDVNA